MSERINQSEANAYHSKGATFTGNPRYTGPRGEVQENPGTITSDSLAAESMNSGGDFASNQSGIAPSQQSSNGFTGNTTDTQGATILPATGSHAQRSEEHGSRMEDAQSGASYSTPRDESDSTAAARSEGVTSGEYSTSSGGNASSGNNTSSGGSTTGGTSSYSSVAAAPSAYSSAGGNNENLKPKPKGQNITEGGFDSDAPNASFNNDVGGANDPGRVAELEFAQRSAREGIDSGYSNATQGKSGGTDKGGFEKLSDDTEA